MEEATSSDEQARDDVSDYADSIVETVREPLLLLDGGLRVKSANRAFYRTFRVSAGETQGRLLYDLGNGQWDIGRLRMLLEELLPCNASFDDYEVEHDFPDIGPKVMLLNARKLRRAGTELILLAIEDVTERRRAEAQRREIESRFTALVKNVKDHSIFTLDAAGRVIGWNVAAEHILGYTEAEALGRDFAFIFTPEDRARGQPQAELRMAREQGRAEDERWHLRKGGGRFWALGIVSALYDAEGRLSGFSMILRDMTAWKQAEEAVRESEARLAFALETCGTGAWDLDLVDHTAHRSVGHERVFGYNHLLSEWTYEMFLEHVVPEDRAMVDDKFRHAKATGSDWNFDCRIRRFDGEVRWIWATGRHRPDPAGRAPRMAGIVQDITERKRAEQALRESEARLSLAWQATREVIWDWDVERDEQRWNDAGVATFGWTDAVRAPQTAAWWTERVHRDDRQRVSEGFHRALEEPTRERWEDEYRFLRSDGSVADVLDRGFILRDDSGKPRRMVGAMQDITARKRAEEALREADRHKDVFLATLAHELRNPLAPICTGLQLIRMLRGDPAGTEQALRIMDRQLTHLVRLVDDLLDVSRIGRGKITLRKERLAVADVVDAALEMSKSGFGRDDRRLVLDVPAGPLPIEGDRVRMVQIVANLLDNAAKFTDQGGRIELSAVRSGDRVEIRVRDDGQGISRERLADIFEPFSQVDPGRSGGLGIGLGLVRSLVEMHGGRVSAASEGPGSGAAFTVSLPLLDGVSVPPRPSDSTEIDAAPGHRVLVVDDNPDITESLGLLLTALQAEVRVAHDGAQALRVCADWLPTHVLMDLGMPGMDGYEAARRLCAEHPQRPFRLIAVSGWGQDEHRQRAREAGFDQHLVKPVAVADLKVALFG